MQYLRARYYEADTARFTQRDTYLGELIRPVSLNQYTYVENNPLAYIDPTGHSVWGSIKSAASKVKTAVVNTAKKVVNTVVNVAKNVYNTVKNVVTTVWNGVQNIWTGAKNQVTQWKNGAVNYAKAKGQAFIEDIKGKINYGGKWISEKLYERVRFNCTVNKRILVADASGNIPGTKNLRQHGYDVLHSDAYQQNLKYQGEALRWMFKYMWDRANDAERRHMIADLLGLIPGIGEAADVVNALYYLIQGNITDASSSGLAAIPIFGYGGTYIKNADKLRDAEKAYDAYKAAGKTVKLSQSSIQHIGKHIPSDFANQVKYLTDEQLTSKLANTSFFNPSWTKDQVISAVEQGYNTLRNKGLTGLQSYTVNGETIKIFIEVDGTFGTAYGLNKLDASFFGR